MSFWLDMEDPTIISRHVENQTRRGMESWPREVLGAGDVSTRFCRQFRDLLTSDAGIRPQAAPPKNPIYIPVNWWGDRKTAEALLYCDRRGLHAVRGDGRDSGRLRHRLLEYDAIERIERGRVLLHSWIVFEDSAGSVVIEYNTAAEDVLSPLLRRLRRESFGARFVENGDRLCQRDYRRLDPRIDPKFANYADECLVSREELITLQYLSDPPPEARRLVILTKREVIDISERVRETPLRPEYGGVWTYTAV